MYAGHVLFGEQQLSKGKHISPYKGTPQWTITTLITSTPLSVYASKM